MTCDSHQGTLIASTSILVTAGGLSITWHAPTENLDGSPLEDLNGYRIYVGTDYPGSEGVDYDQHFEVPDASVNYYFLPLERGDYRLAMTAVDAEGNESPPSNEIYKSVY